MSTSTSGAPPGVDRPGPSARERLNLIDQITSAAVASDYADVSDQQPAGSRRQRVLVAAVALGLAGFVLALGISARVLNDPVVNEQRSALIDRIVAADGRNEALIEEVAAARQDLTAAREDNLRVTLEGAQLADADPGPRGRDGLRPCRGTRGGGHAHGRAGHGGRGGHRRRAGARQRRPAGRERPVVGGRRGDRRQRPAPDRTVRDPVGGRCHPGQLPAAQAALSRGGDRPAGPCRRSSRRLPMPRSWPVSPSSSA